SEEHTSELQSLTNLVCRLLLEKKNKRGLRPSRGRPVRQRARHQRPASNRLPAEVPHRSRNSLRARVKPQKYSPPHLRKVQRHTRVTAVVLRLAVVLRPPIEAPARPAWRRLSDGGGGDLSVGAAVRRRHHIACHTASRGLLFFFKEPPPP